MTARYGCAAVAKVRFCAACRGEEVQIPVAVGVVTDLSAAGAAAAAAATIPPLALGRDIQCALKVR